MNSPKAFSELITRLVQKNSYNVILLHKKNHVIGIFLRQKLDYVLTSDYNMIFS